MGVLCLGGLRGCPDPPVNARPRAVLYSIDLLTYAFNFVETIFYTPGRPQLTSLKLPSLFWDYRLSHHIWFVWHWGGNVGCWSEQQFCTPSHAPSPFKARTTVVAKLVDSKAMAAGQSALCSAPKIRAYAPVQVQTPAPPPDSGSGAECRLQS